VSKKKLNEKLNDVFLEKRRFAELFKEEKEAREYAEEIITTIREPLVVLDTDLKVILANKAFYQTFKVNPKETTNQFIYDLGNGQWNIPKLKKLLEDILPKNNFFDSFEVDHNFETIGPKAMLLNARRIPRPPKKPKIILLAIEDITYRKKKEQDKLETSELRYRRLFETAQDGILLVDFKTGIIKDVNPFLINLLNYSKADFQKKHLWEIGVFKDIIMSKKHFLALQAKKHVHFNNLLLETKNGKKIEVEFIANAYRTDGELIIQCNIRDITKRKQTEEELKASELKYSTLVEKGNDGILVIQGAGVLEYVNSVICQMTGFTKEESIGKSFLDFLSPEYKKIVAERYEKRLKGQDAPNRYEIEILSKTGNKLPVEVNSSRIIYKDKPAIMAIIRDITERKQTENILKARARLLVFANSHSMDELLEEALNEIEKLTGSLIGFFHFVNSDQKTLTLQNWSTRTKKEFCKAEGKGSHYAIEKAGVWVDCVYQRKPVIHNDYESLLNKKGMPKGHAKVVRELVVPVIRGDKIMAVLGVGNKSSNYDEQDVKLVSFFADLTWDITEAKLAEVNLIKLNRALRMVGEINQMLIHVTDEIDLLSEACRIIVETGGYRLAWVGYVKHDEAKTILPIAHAGLESGYIKKAKLTWADTERGRGPGGIAIRTGNPSIVHDIATDPTMSPWKEDALKRGYKSIIALPLVGDDKVFGVIGIYSIKSNTFALDEIKLLKELVDDLAFGVTSQRVRVEHGKIEQKLKESEIKFETIFEDSKDGLLVADPETSKFSTCNTAICNMLRYTKKELLDLGVDDIHPKKDAPFVKKIFREQVKGKLKLVSNLPVLRKDGSIFYADINISRLIVNRKMYLLGSFRDVTERNRMEQAKDDFLNMATHDLRTPVSVIRANTEMILDGDYGEIPPKLKVPLEDVSRANTNLINIINDFLTMSRIEKGKITIVPKLIDLVPILGYIVKQTKPLIEKKGLKFNYKIPTKIPKVMADCEKIPEAIVNLLDNAIKYTDKGSISLEVLAKENSVIVAIKDTGIGIAKDRQKELFQKYAQVSDGKKIPLGKGTGLGLGLYIARKIIEGCGGKIWVEAELGKGSTFYFSLPILKINKEKDM